MWLTRVYTIKGNIMNKYTMIKLLIVLEMMSFLLIKQLAGV